MEAEDLGDDEVLAQDVTMARRFVGQCCLLDPQLIVPMRLLWAAYRAWALERGAKPSAQALRYLLDASPWCAVEELPGRGRIRVMVRRMGLKP